MNEIVKLLKRGESETLEFKITRVAQFTLELKKIEKLLDREFLIKL